MSTAVGSGAQEHAAANQFEVMALRKQRGGGGDAHPVHLLELLAERLLRHLEPHEG